MASLHNKSVLNALRALTYDLYNIYAMFTHDTVSLFSETLKPNIGRRGESAVLGDSVQLFFGRFSALRQTALWREGAAKRWDTAIHYI